MRSLGSVGVEAHGLDVLPSPFTQHVASIGDRMAVRNALQGMDAVLHTATLHKPHVATHPEQEFVEVNVSGTLVLLQEAVAAGIRSFVFTSTTSTFGRALVPAPHQPAAWITEETVPVAKNIYGVTKVAAEQLCELFSRSHGLPVIILKTSRFFPESDDDPEMQRQYADENAKLNELLFRRVDIEDAVAAHVLALERAPALGFGRYIITATTPFSPADCAQLRVDAPAVVRRHVPELDAVYAQRGYRMFPSIDRVYVNERASRDLGFRPRHDFAHALQRLQRGEPIHSKLTYEVGSKGYHRTGS